MMTSIHAARIPFELACQTLASCSCLSVAASQSETFASMTPVMLLEGLLIGSTGPTSASGAWLGSRCKANGLKKVVEA